MLPFNALTNTVLGIAFFVVGTAATLLMYHLWGYPFDHKTLKSEAPPKLMFLHRVLGYVYFGIYILLMTQMVPRLWRYQVEFPARTVAHLLLGMAIGTVLVIKIVIVRFFKHLEGTLAPVLGTTLLVFTVLLLGLSIPFSLRAAYLQRHATGGSAFGPENVHRVEMLLPTAGLPAEAPLMALASPPGLRRGQMILLNQCVDCHDLRTVLAKPRTPDDWVQTVHRMGDRSTVLQPISDEDQWYVSAYLIAISPELQREVVKRRTQDLAQTQSQQAAEVTLQPGNGASAGLPTSRPPVAIDLTTAKKTFETRCVQCHELSDVSDSPPKTAEQTKALVARMVKNGMKAQPDEIDQIVFYLNATYVK
jgi:mono/diheme cytochrome c family protein